MIAEIIIENTQLSLLFFFSKDANDLDQAHHLPLHKSTCRQGLGVSNCKLRLTMVFYCIDMLSYICPFNIRNRMIRMVEMDRCPDMPPKDVIIVLRIDTTCADFILNSSF